MPAEEPGPADLQAAFAATVVDEWARAGVSHAVVCPGSRSTPLVMALAAQPRLQVHVRLDERSAGFTALGIGLATDRPAVVVTTSGTAAVELHAAVAEADRAGVPLVACTADRPPELQGFGAHQTLDQVRLFGGAVRWFCDPGVAEPAARRSWRSLAARAVGETTAGPRGPGPVHLNLPFREPLLGDPARAGGASTGRPGGGPWHSVGGSGAGADDGADDGVAELLGAARGLVVAGAGCGDPATVLALARALGWPVLADPRSGARVDDPFVVAAADGILRSERFAAEHLPEVVLHLGDRWLSRVVEGFFSRAHAEGAHQIAVDPFGRWRDPAREVRTFVRARPADFCRLALERVARRGRGDGSWPGEWHAAEQRAQKAIDDALAMGGMASSGLSEPSLARTLVAGLPSESALVVAASMPIRDVEAYAGPRPDPPRVLANRGANGIDGVVSTALGVALAGAGPTVALVGDLAFFHDVSALLRTPGAGPDLTVVVADNCGGGIFSFLDVAESLGESAFDELFGTPQRADVAEVAAAFGWPVDDVGPGEGRDAVALLDEALGRRLRAGGRSVIRVRLPSRSDNVAVHRRVEDAVVAAVEAAGDARVARAARGGRQQGRGS